MQVRKRCPGAFLPPFAISDAGVWSDKSSRASTTSTLRSTATILFAARTCTWTWKSSTWPKRARCRSRASQEAASGSSSSRSNASSASSAQRYASICRFWRLQTHDFCLGFFLFPRGTSCSRRHPRKNAACYLLRSVWLRANGHSFGPRALLTASSRCRAGWIHTRPPRGPKVRASVQWQDGTPHTASCFLSLLSFPFLPSLSFLLSPAPPLLPISLHLRRE